MLLIHERKIDSYGGGAVSMGARPQRESHRPGRREGLNADVEELTAQITTDFRELGI